MSIPLRLSVNGADWELTVAEDALLLEVLREQIGCTSVREGCGVGACGACTVLVGAPRPTEADSSRRGRDPQTGGTLAAGEREPASPAGGDASSRASASVSSCLALAARYDGAEITTTEGLPAGDPVVEAFVAEGAMQCGYCIPGFVLMAHELLAENPRPSHEEIVEHLAGNLCRCGSYQEICAAVAAAAQAEGEQHADGHRAG